MNVFLHRWIPWIYKSLEVYRLCTFKNVWDTGTAKIWTCARNLYLTKENELKKPEKHDLTNAIEVKLQVTPIKYVPIDDGKHDFATW